ncbi:MAG: TolC family protein, partial [Vampirovibrionales bacterium]
LQKQCQWEETLNRRTLETLTAYFAWQRELTFLTFMQALLKEMNTLYARVMHQEALQETSPSDTSPSEVTASYRRTLQSDLLRPALLDQQVRTLRAETSANQQLSQVFLLLNQALTPENTSSSLASTTTTVTLKRYQTSKNLPWLTLPDALPQAWYKHGLPLVPEKLLSISMLRLAEEEARVASTNVQASSIREKPLTLSELMCIARQNRPLLAQRYLQLAVIEYAFKARRADLLSPTLSMDASVRQTGPEAGQLERSTRYYGGVSWYPLQGLGQTYLAEQADMKARREAAQLAYQNTLNQVELNLQTQLLQYRLLEKQRQLSETKLREALRVMQALKEGDAQEIGVWLRTMSVWSDAQADYFSAVRDLNLIQLQILAELGLLTPEWLLNHVLWSEKPSA